MADWVRDPETGEWVYTVGAEGSPLVAPAPPLNPDTPGVYPHATVGPYRAVPSISHPVDGVAGQPTQDGPPLGPAPSTELTSDLDYEVIAAWEREARARGNEVRVTAVGTFEVDPGGRIVSRMPLAYRRI